MSNIDSLADEINKALKEYTTEVEEGLDKAKEKLAKEGVKTLKETSPRRKKGKRRRYAEGWRAKTVGTSWVVHNATNYQLTHLLEKGHAKVSGGRVGAIPHIAPVEDQMIKDYEKEVERVIKG